MLWRLTYVIQDGSGMSGVEPAPTRTLETEIATEGLDITGEDEQMVLEQMRGAVHAHAGHDAVLTDAQPA